MGQSPAMPGGGGGGVSADEHAAHHPKKLVGKGEAPAGATEGGAGAGMGGMMGGMEKMMEGMHGPPPKELYPSLMELPELSTEKRAEIAQQADERMKAGHGRLSHAVEKLHAAIESEDYAALQKANEQMREALAQFESGLAARRALAEGMPPREMALQWFKREMNLASPLRPEESHAPGVTLFHLFTMVLLVAFALAMVAMYFFKMRRAADLFGRLEQASGAPPPGSAPPLSGGPGPSSPPDPIGKSPPPGGASPPSGPPTPPSPTAPQAEETPATGPPAGESPAAPVDAKATSASLVTANWRGRLRVGSIVTETPSVKTIRLLPDSNGRFLPFTFVPGQFLNVAFWIGGARMNRSYSISSSPTQREYVEVTVRREPRGAVSRHIDDLLKVGDLIEAGGPVGRFTFTGTEADSIVLIAGGVGITPMMSIARYLTSRAWDGDIYFIYTCRTPQDFIFANEIADLQRRNPRLHVAVTVTSAEDTWDGPRGRISKEWLTQTVPALASRRIHLCGPPPMMEATKALLAELGVPPDQVKTEAFGATRPALAAPGASVKPTALATGPLVTFSKNGKSAKIHLGQTVLELSEELGIGIENSCRVGTCGVCKVKLTSGEVEMAVEDALDPDDKANGIILACQARPLGAVTVEA
jgi:ferredoxin-NADP reductase